MVRVSTAKNFKVNIIYQDGGWENVECFEGRGTEGGAFLFAEEFIKQNQIKGAEIQVLASGCGFWKVLDKQGRIIQRPVTGA